MRLLIGLCPLLGLVLLICAVDIAVGESCTAAEPAAADGHALQALFGEKFLAENVLAVRRRAAQLSDEERFRLLCEWVLPGPSHAGFRLAGDFTPTCPVPSSHDRENEPDSPDRTTSPASRIMTGGELVSPVFDLVDVAKATGRLEELADRVAQIPTGDHATRRGQVALLLLIRLAQDDQQAAQSTFGLLFDLFRESDHADVSERWPETLALARGTTHPATRDMAGELLYLLYEMYLGDHRGWRSRGTLAWDHWYFSTFGRHKHQALHADTEFHAAPPFDNWAPVCDAQAKTRGKGLPRAHWHWTGREVLKLSGHSTDYLYYRIPLQGEFEVECELTPAAWRTTELMLGGIWVSPYWYRTRSALGNFRYAKPMSELTRNVAEIDEWIRFRVVVRDQVCTFFANGWEVHREPVTDGWDPWLAIRSEARAHSGIRNLRITGQPTVPGEIHLAALPELPGWLPYQDYGVGRNSAWRQSFEFSLDGGITGRHNPQLRGSRQESLLRYHRPILEDGTIEYEFYYEPGAVEVHPALDRLAFLIEPEGIQVHWMTDDQYDRTALDPGNRIVEQENRRGPVRPPLRPAQWNRLRLTVRGDCVSLELNGEHVYERLLEPSNQRTFGLFHFADQTEARVRNIVWRGDWPRHVPPVAEQELALPDPEYLDGLDVLDEKFVHDFSIDGLPPESFEMTGKGTITLHSSGLQVRPMVREEHTSSRVEYRPPIYGDFDATLEFADLKASYGERGMIGLQLSAVDDTGVIVSSARMHRDKRRVSSAARISIPLPDNTKGQSATYHADATDHGMLRLVRRGAMVHALIAHGDSPNYRHLGSHRLPAAGTAVRIEAQVVSVGKGSVEVFLKRLSIRSNSSAIERRVDPRVAALNQYTLGLAGQDRRNLAASGDAGFLNSNQPHVKRSEDGLQMRSHDNPMIPKTFVAYRRGVQDDFDVSTSFDELQLPEKAGNAAAVELSVAVGGKSPTVAALSILRADSGKLQITARMDPVQPTDADTPPAVATVEVESIDSLRIARIQRTVFFLYVHDGSYRLLDMTDIDSGAVKPGTIRFQVSGSRETAVKVLLKTFEVRASQFTD